jgi:hypothetical protein
VYYVQSLALETYQGLPITGGIDNLIMKFIIDMLVLVTGLVVAALVSGGRSFLRQISCSARR